ncbi:MAG: helix-turn-helix transcriptional regulator [Tepidiformaceae bacterium]
MALEPNSLSERELQVLTLLADGQGNAEIAQFLWVSLNTVKTHVKHIFEKLDVHSRSEAAAVYWREIHPNG